MVSGLNVQHCCYVKYDYGKLQEVLVSGLDSGGQHRKVAQISGPQAQNWGNQAIIAWKQAYACVWRPLTTPMPCCVCGWGVRSFKKSSNSRMTTWGGLQPSEWSVVFEGCQQSCRFVGPTSITRTWRSVHVIVALNFAFAGGLVKTGKCGEGQLQTPRQSFSLTFHPFDPSAQWLLQLSFHFPSCLDTNQKNA